MRLILAVNLLSKQADLAQDMLPVTVCSIIAGAATILAALMVVLAATVTVAGGLIQDKYSMSKKVTLKYVGPAASTADFIDTAGSKGSQSADNDPQNLGPGAAAAVGRTGTTIVGLRPQVMPRLSPYGVTITSKRRPSVRQHHVLQRRHACAAAGALSGA